MKSDYYNKKNHNILTRFAKAKGLRILANLLQEYSINLSNKEEVIEKIFIFLNKIQITSEILTNYRVLFL